MAEEAAAKHPDFVSRRARLARYWPESLIAEFGCAKLSAREQDLVAALGLWRKVYESVGSTVALSTVQGEVCFVSGVGASRDIADISGRMWHELVPFDQIPLIQGKIDQAIAAKDMVRYEITMQGRQTGALLHAECCTWPIIENNEIIGIFSSTRDITEQKAAEVRNLQAAQMAALGEILGAITHEINNPLTIINEASSAVREVLVKFPDAMQAAGGRLEQMRRGVQRIIKTVTVVKSMFRPEGSNDKAFAIAESFQELAILCGERFKCANIEFRVSSPAETLRVRGDINSFNQCLLNLLNNAYDAVNETTRAWIRLDFRIEGREIVILVGDSGVMSPCIRDKVLTVDFTTKSRGVGTGIGLKLVRRIIHDLNGQIFLDEKSPTTCFVIRLKLE